MEVSSHEMKDNMAYGHVTIDTSELNLIDAAPVCNGCHCNRKNILSKKLFVNST